MANEKKTEQTATTQSAATETAQTAKNLFVEREIIKDKNGNQYESQDGRAYYAYVVRGKVRGRDIKVDFAPKDKGGYEPLDIVFDVSPKAELSISDGEMEDDNGKKTKYKIYTIWTIVKKIDTKREKK